MSENAFIGRKIAPTDADLDVALGKRARTRWDALVARMRADADVDTETWSSYAPKAGWSLKLIRKKRTIVYVTPWSRSFGVAFAVGEAARRQALETAVPAAVREALESARRYAEGYAVRFAVRNRRDVDAVLALAAAKIGGQPRPRH